MNFIKVGSHSINTDRISDVWEEHDQAGSSSGRLIVFCGDHAVALVGSEADEMRQFVDAHLKNGPSSMMGRITMNSAVGDRLPGEPR